MRNVIWILFGNRYARRINYLFFKTSNGYWLPVINRSSVSNALRVLSEISTCRGMFRSCGHGTHRGTEMFYCFRCRRGTNVHLISGRDREVILFVFEKGRSYYNTAVVFSAPHIRDRYGNNVFFCNETFRVRHVGVGIKRKSFPRETRLQLPMQSVDFVWLKRDRYTNGNLQKSIILSNCSSTTTLFVWNIIQFRFIRNLTQYSICMPPPPQKKKTHNLSWSKNQLSLCHVEKCTFLCIIVILTTASWVGSLQFGVYYFFSISLWARENIIGQSRLLFFELLSRNDFR